MNILYLGNTEYHLNNSSDSRESSYLCLKNSEDGKVESVYLDMYFEENPETGFSPSISINPIHPDNLMIQDLKGFTFEVKTPEESYEREDSFYYSEHEPFKNYVLKIEDLKEDSVTVFMKGIAITDGYCNPYRTEEFEIRCTIPVKK